MGSGERPQRVDWDEKFALDVWYVDHRSARLDLDILARTVTQVFSGHGVSAPGHTTMEPFRGSVASEEKA